MDQQDESKELLPQQQTNRHHVVFPAGTEVTVTGYDFPHEMVYMGLHGKIVCQNGECATVEIYDSPVAISSGIDAVFFSNKHLEKSGPGRADTRKFRRGKNHE